MVKPARSSNGVGQVAFQPKTAIATDHLARALTFKTLSFDSGNPDKTAFLDFHTFLERSYPATHSALSRTVINEYSLLYHWQGSEAQLPPILLLAHFDVVPANSADWQHPPFAGHVESGVIWGRGALDDKGSLIAIMEAVESLLRGGFKPRRSIYLAFGHDEEIGGQQGAKHIARKLEDNNLQFDLILDEGSMIADGILEQIEQPIALIGPAEKGYISLQLSSESTGGHSSMPPKHTAIGRIAGAITRLEENPFPANRDLTEQFFAQLMPHMPFFTKTVFANTWFFQPLIDWRISNNPALNAGVRTTTAATIINGGTKENILPQRAVATINVRLIPGDTVDPSIERIRQIVNDSAVQIHVKGEAIEASVISDLNGPGYALLKDTIQHLNVKTLVAPRLVVGVTDARHYQNLSKQIFRFAYFPVRPDTINSIHGRDERVTETELIDAIRFYYQLIHNSNLL